MDKHEKESFFDFEIRQKWKVSNFLPAPQNQASEQDVSFEDFAIEEYADVVELVDSLDLGSNARACRFESCHPHQIVTPNRNRPIRG